MHTQHPQRPQQTIVSLTIKQLYPHPANPGRMSKAAFAKLVRHIQSTGQYEPLVVRKHPTHENTYQILNGHHRLRALKQLAHTHADCVVFEADDRRAQLYLLSLNRLCGRDNTYKKAKLIERLCRAHSSRELARWLPDSKTAIEKLNTLSQNQPLPKPSAQTPVLLPMTFFMTEDQHALISRAFEKALCGEHVGTPTQKRLCGLMRLAEDFLGKDSYNRCG